MRWWKPSWTSCTPIRRSTRNRGRSGRTTFLDGLINAGFTDVGAAATHRASTSFLLGHLLLDVAALQVETSQIADTEPDPGAAAPTPVGTGRTRWRGTPSCTASRVG